MTYSVPAGRYGDTSTAFIQAYIDEKVAGVIDLAPETLNTLNEVAAAIGDDADFITTVNNAIAAVQADVNANETAAANLVSALETARELVTDAISARVTTLETDPTTQTVVDNLETALDARLDALEADPTTQTLLDAEETARENADDALSGRLDTLEADPTTQTLLDAEIDARISADDTQAVQLAGEANTRATNDNALSGRLDVLEADPTTATAVVAVQSDVNQNEADADAAIALKLDIADPAATGKLTVDTNASLEFDSNLTKLHNELRGTSIVVGNNITLNPAAADGRVEIEGEFYLRPSDLTDAADDTAAAAAGIIVGQVYRNGSQLMVRVS